MSCLVRGTGETDLAEDHTRRLGREANVQLEGGEQAVPGSFHE